MYVPSAFVATGNPTYCGRTEGYVADGKVGRSPTVYSVGANLDHNPVGKQIAATVCAKAYRVGCTVG